MFSGEFAGLHANARHPLADTIVTGVCLRECIDRICLRDQLRAGCERQVFPTICESK